HQPSPFRPDPTPALPCVQGRAGPEKGSPAMPQKLDPSLLPPVVMPDVEHPQWLKGQKALVTGANSGIGRAVAIALGRAGADVVVNYRSGDADAAEVVAAAGATGSRAYPHRADVSKEDEVRNMFERMFREFGTIDILVANAGLQQDAPFEQMTLEKWNTV